MGSQFLMGHVTDKEAGTGVTVILAPLGAVGGVSVRGSAPGTRETDLLRPTNSVQKAHAIVLSGGSAFGLEACNGVMEYLHEKGYGFKAGKHRVPIVCGAVLFDLDYKKFSYPTKAMGYAGAKKAMPLSQQSGCIGAGTGATIGKLLGPGHASKGGLGVATVQMGEAYVTAIVAVNAIGDIYDGNKMVAGIKYDKTVMELLLKSADYQCVEGQNTTIGCLLTNAELTKEEANKLADLAHDGLALSIRPVHTSMDGDTIFTMAEGGCCVDFLVLQAASLEAVKQAVLRSVHP